MKEWRKIYQDNTNEDKMSIMMLKQISEQRVLVGKEHHCTMIQESLHQDLTFMCLIMQLQNRAKSKRTARRIYKATVLFGDINTPFSIIDRGNRK